MRLYSTCLTNRVQIPGNLPTCTKFDPDSSAPLFIPNSSAVWNPQWLLPAPQLKRCGNSTTTASTECKSQWIYVQILPPKESIFRVPEPAMKALHLCATHVSPTAKCVQVLQLSVYTIPVHYNSLNSKGKGKEVEVQIPIINSFVVVKGRC